jgi:hypothetical protein
MPLNSKIKVPLPETGVIVRSNGKRYVYKVLKSYRNDKGQPTNMRKAIGRLDAESGMLIPNDAYYEFYEKPATVEVLPSHDSVKSVGATFLLGHILNAVGVTDILKEVLGRHRAMATVTAAIYMACKGNVFERVLDWCEGCIINEEPLSSQSASVLFAGITHDERMAFFKPWINRNSGGYLVYDVTSFSTYAEGISDSEWGYNRDHDKLPQINLGCYLPEKAGLPVFYVTYPGSIVDKSHMPYMMANNKELGIKDIGFVMDRGFCSTSNITYLHSERSRYIIGVDVRHKTTREAIDRARDGIVSLRNRACDGVYACAVHSRFYGALSTMHVYYSPERAEMQRRDLFRTVENLEGKLAQINTLSEKEAKKYKGYFKISRSSDGAFTSSRDYDKIDSASGNCGFFCLLSNAGLPSDETLTIYKRRDVLEKSFDDIKNHIDMKRLRTHTDSTTDGKIFCAFIALIAVSELMNKLRGFMREKSMSKDSIISELEKIKVVNVSGNIRMINPLTKTQRKIFETFGLCEDNLKAFVLPTNE